MSDINQKCWISVCGLGVAVAASIAAAAMTGSCVFGTGTNFCERFGVRCKEGQECAAQQVACIDIGGCGDGITDRDKGEVCDDGNIVDGQMVDGKFVLDDCSHDCKSDQRCGNSIIDVRETCDNGPRNGQPDDICDDHCQLRDKMYGNGTVDKDMGEQCDPGVMDSAGCNSNLANSPMNLFDPKLPAGCRFSRCGDGYVNAAAGETCDSGGMIIRDCNGPLCTKPVCGDNFHNAAADEDCDNGPADTPGCNGDQGGSRSCKFPACGDGYVNKAFNPPGSKHTETCDTGGDTQNCNGDGNGIRDNDPDAECQLPRCGDGYVNIHFTPNDADAVESCDKGGADTAECNGNNKGSNGPGSCRIPSCGDGYINTMFKPQGSTLTEFCDTKGDSQACNGDGNGDSHNNPNAQCQQARCGDGYVNTMSKPQGSTLTETCDTAGDSQACNGDGNGDSHNNPDAQCQQARCGDGYVNPAFAPFVPPGMTSSPALTEQCDTGGIDTAKNGSTKGCNGNNNGPHGPGSCRFSTCGDGYKNVADGEQCDPGDPSHGIPAIPCSSSQETCHSNCTCS